MPIRADLLWNSDRAVLPDGAPRPQRLWSLPGRTIFGKPVHNFFRKFIVAFALWAAAGAAGIAAAKAGVAVIISSTYAQLVAGQTLQFSATVTGTNDTRVIWQVNNADGGEPASGTISPSGLYSPPQHLPN